MLAPGLARWCIENVSEMVSADTESRDPGSHLVDRDIADFVGVTSPVSEEENIASSESRFHGFATKVPRHIDEKLYMR